MYLLVICYLFVIKLHIRPFKKQKKVLIQGFVFELSDVEAGVWMRNRPRDGQKRRASRRAELARVSESVSLCRDPGFPREPFYSGLIRAPQRPLCLSTARPPLIGSKIDYTLFMRQRHRSTGAHALQSMGPCNQRQRSGDTRVRKSLRTQIKCPN